MGNHLSRRSSGAGRVILSDGTVREFDRSTPVAELMLEHPQHFVVELRSISDAGTKLAPLPADYNLDPDKVYLMLPMPHGKTAVLSAEKARRILSRTRSILQPRSRIFPRNLSLITGMCVAGGVAGDEMEEEAEKVGGLQWSPEVFGEEPEFLSRQFSSKGWKPSLNTIEERGMVRKVPHWLF